jgi:hypothetical protein
VNDLCVEVHDGCPQDANADMHADGVACIGVELQTGAGPANAPVAVHAISPVLSFHDDALVEQLIDQVRNGCVRQRGALGELRARDDAGPQKMIKHGAQVVRPHHVVVSAGKRQRGHAVIFSS